MKLFKKTIFFLLIISWYLTSAQDSIRSKKEHEIDSLIFYNNFPEAEKEVDLLYSLLPEAYNNGEQYKKMKLAAMIYKADIYALKQEHSKAIKTALTIIDLAQKENLPEKEYQACLIAAVTYEQAEHFDLCKKYLDRAYKLYQKNKLDNNYSTYCIRSSSYYRLIKEKDSALHFAYKGLKYAQKYNNRRELADAHLLLSMLLSRDKHQEAVKYASLAAKDFMNRNDYKAAANMYSNITHSYIEHKEFKKAFLYNDSTIQIYKKYTLLPESYYFVALKHRSQLFNSIGNKDSAYYYFQKYHNAFVLGIKKQEAAEIKNITEKYENDKKEITIKNKNQQLIFAIVLLVVIAVATIVIIRRNRKINSQNKIISKQLLDLTKILEQKQVLLSELQHRVKNNLQHVISILEIQKESVDFNNVEELMRENKNRIHSMALLHKKLNVFENVNDVDVKQYINELSELVKDSYDNHKKKIQLDVKCEIDTISIEKALPIGLIIVELISNSIKHAFTEQNTCVITIQLAQEKTTQKNRLYYADNGIGFDFNTTKEKGLGIEIIKGLIDQLNGIATAQNSNGLELTIYF